MSDAGTGDDTRAAVEGRTRGWLEDSDARSMRELRGREAVVYDAAGRPRTVTLSHFQEVFRKLKIFRWLEQQPFDSFLDVGSGIDIYPQLVAARYGVRAYYSDFTHQRNLPYAGPAFGKLDHAVTLNVASLPFADGAFDVVLASEVLEHLVRPVEAIAELLRVTRRYLIMTSLEALAADARERRRSHRRVDVRIPHVERNFLLLDEFDAIFGDFHHENLLFDGTLPASAFASEVEQTAAYGALDTTAKFEDALVKALAVTDHRPGAMGILLVKAKPGAALAAPRPTDDPPLARWLIERAAWAERTGLEMLRLHPGPEDFARRDRPVDPGLLALLRCPDCRTPLAGAPGGVRCPSCGAQFGAEFGVPILYPTGAAEPADVLARLCRDDGARRRIVGRLVRRLRRNERPPGPLRRLAWRLEDTFRPRR